MVSMRDQKSILHRRFGSSLEPGLKPTPMGCPRGKRFATLLTFWRKLWGMDVGRNIKWVKNMFERTVANYNLTWIYTFFSYFNLHILEGRRRYSLQFIIFLTTYFIPDHLEDLLIHSYNHWKKCWDDLMAILEFGPLSPLYNVDRSPVVNFLFGPLNVVWWG